VTQPDGDSPTNPNNTVTSLTEDQRVGYYVEMWKKSVDVQQHFNDIEWRIRGLALTVATFALGAAGLAAKDGTKVGSVSLGAVIMLIGLQLWYAFYFVDRAWYHPLLKAAVAHGSRIEDEIKLSLPEAGMTRAITRGSAYKANGLVLKLSRTASDTMHSENKLVWFYMIGASAFIIGAVALQGAALISNPKPVSPPEVVVRLQQGPPLLPTPNTSLEPSPAPKK
jgi:hypothetical protein